MKMSCNGCRVLRKGCSDDCVIRPCLEWINSPDSQANATMFLTKFYGRAGLVNLISAGPERLRSAIFRSLLYEACGRIINPISGSVGLLWSGKWSQCQSAVDSVLKGSAQLMRHPTLIDSSQSFPPLKTYDIRHVPKGSIARTTSYDLHKVKEGPGFKRSSLKQTETKPVSRWIYDTTSCDSTWLNRVVSTRDSPEATNSMFSVETVEASAVSRPGPGTILRFDEPKSTYQSHMVKLDLTLSVGPRASMCKAELADHQ